MDEFRADLPLYNAVSGRMYAGRAPQEDFDKYIVFYLISDILDEEFAYARRIEVARIQFSIFCKSTKVSDIGDIYEKLIAVYDRATLTFTIGDWKSVEMSREMSHLIREEDDYWMYTVDYIVMTQPSGSTTTTTCP